MAYRHLNEKDRFYIEQRLSEGDSMRSIARALGFAPSTVSRETKRHTPSDFNGLYCHRLASCCAQEKRSNAKQGQDFQKISERKRRYLGRYFAHPMMQNRRAKRDDYKPSAVRVTQRYVP
ncbi:helix-turn-helix domain-containing protein [Piscirickettsia salmonis]|uniref:helix-turn-helix domain-containing protein n=1 Tax=Piscirickettsia salmonis TaxID=1238 RepID=UPI0012BAE63A|nr:Transposase, IS30 family [Piscirickettsia salmonis]